MNENAQEKKDELDFETSSKKYFIIGLISIFSLMILIIFASKYFYFEKTAKILKYNEFEFTFLDGNWYTQWQRGNNVYQIPLRYNPFEVEYVPIKGKLDDSFNSNSVIYIAIDPSINDKYLTLAVSELSLSLIRALGLNVEAACTKDNSSVCINRTITNCENNENSVIEFKLEGDSEIITYDKCIILKGEGLNLLKSVDKLLYKWYGIIK